MQVLGEIDPHNMRLKAHHSVAGDHMHPFDTFAVASAKYKIDFGPQNQNSGKNARIVVSTTASPFVEESH